MAPQTRTLPKRQALRRVGQLLAFFSFPVIMNFFSPYLIVQGSFEGILAGSAIVFASLFVGSLLFGRLFCGWICPVAALEDTAAPINNRRVARRARLVKWAIWVPWIALILFAVINAGGYHSVQPLYGTEGGISLAGSADRPIIFAYIIYFMVVALFFGLALALGRRGGCHTVCWISPFMILGRWLRNKLGAWPSLRLVSDTSTCNGCARCTTECPMSIDVAAHAQAGTMEDSECILCGACVDNCPRRSLRYSFSSGR